MATTLEKAPKKLADRALAPRGWDEGKHGSVQSAEQRGAEDRF